MTTLYRAASLVRSDASDLAEFEILDLLTPVLDANLTTYALDVIALVRTLHLDELMTGPAPPLDSGRVVTTSSPGRSGPRRDYAHAIVTALRVRLATSDEGGCEEAA